MAAFGKASSGAVRAGPDGWLLPVATVLLEAVCGVALLFPATQHAASYAATVLGGLFVVFRRVGGRVGLQGDRGERGCGCLGARLTLPEHVEPILPWLVVAGGLCGVVARGSEYAGVVTVSVGVALAAAEASWSLWMVRRASAIDPWVLVQSELDSPRFAWLPRAALRSLRRYEVGPNQWVSNDIAVGDRVVRLEVRFGRRILWTPRAKISVAEILAFDSVAGRS
jgi:hypothetical protein